MKLLFNMEYQTHFGEDLILNIVSKDDTNAVSQHKMTTVDGYHWFVELSKAMSPSMQLNYYYSLMRGEEVVRHELLLEPHRLEMAAAFGEYYRI